MSLKQNFHPEFYCMFMFAEILIYFCLIITHASQASLIILLPLCVCRSGLHWKMIFLWCQCNVVRGRYDWWSEALRVWDRNSWIIYLPFYAASVLFLLCWVLIFHWNYVMYFKYQNNHYGILQIINGRNLGKLFQVLAFLQPFSPLIFQRAAKVGKYRVIFPKWFNKIDSGFMLFSLLYLSC